MVFESLPLSSSEPQAASGGADERQDGEGPETAPRGSVHVVSLSVVVARSRADSV